MTTSLDHLFGAESEPDLVALLGALEPSPESRDLVMLYAAATYHLAGECDDYEYREIGYEGPIPRYDGSGVAARWLRAHVPSPEHQTVQAQTGALGFLLFDSCYEDWWDFEAYDWGGQDDLGARTWFDGESLLDLIPLVTRLAPRLAASDWGTAMLHVSLADLLESNVLELPRHVPAASLHSQLHELHQRLFAELARIFLGRDPEHPLGWELRCLHHVMSDAGDWAQAKALWSSLPEVHGVGLVYEVMFSLVLRDHDPKGAVALWPRAAGKHQTERDLLAELERRARPQTIERLAEFATAFCERYPESIYLGTFLADHQPTEPRRRALLLKVVERLPDGVYLASSSDGHRLVHDLDYSSSYRDAAFRGHLDAVLPLRPPPAYCARLLAMLERFEQKYGRDEQTARARTTLRAAMSGGYPT